MGKEKIFRTLTIRNMPYELKNKMQEECERTGKSMSHQMRRAIRFWFEKQEEVKKLNEKKDKSIYDNVALDLIAMKKTGEKIYIEVGGTFKVNGITYMCMLGKFKGDCKRCHFKNKNTECGTYLCTDITREDVNFVFFKRMGK